MTTHSHDIDFKNDFTVTPQEGSMVEIKGEIPYAELQKERANAIKKLGRDVKVDGFREGKVPEEMLVERIGETAILTEMAERALGHHYSHILEAHEIDAIGQPQVEITKIAADNPLGFTATVAVVPDITLPDYKTLAATANQTTVETEVTDADVEKQIADILRQKVAYERLQQKANQNTEATEVATDATDLPTPESEAKKAETEAAEETDPEKMEPPELTDELVATLGQPGQFTTVDDFKTKLREHIAIEKQQEAAAKHRGAITDSIIAGATLELPQVLVDSELNQMFAQMEEDLSRSQLKMEDYLAHIKKSREDLVTEWTPAAEKRAKLQLILNEIARAEDIKPDEEALNAQVEELKKQYQDADEKRVRVYVASVMTNEAVMKMLEEA